jgi:hypothetical protein
VYDFIDKDLEAWQACSRVGTIRSFDFFLAMILNGASSGPSKNESGAMGSMRASACWAWLAKDLLLISMIFVMANGLNRSGSSESGYSYLPYFVLYLKW